ncbi:hypothetical protein Osc7112_1462 [Oscillatoria nigro-viridis PCC 7112]|uniref:Uncharacterized protein n=1 Tax=Phormidium nigroviride PCC 7112 TaxID=179408 RepID=K9VFG2_9CYAN|nr:hypothetical protein [Oscillatoria nigro-viridis]AFZ05985.1 hypothetical protein Osc7112_1462 [Oscillatoria nigro-viridis PCC 7112]
MCLKCSAERKKLVELTERLIVRGILGGLPLTFHLAKERKYKAHSLALWTVLIQVSNEQLLRQLKDKRSMDKSFEHLLWGNRHLLWSFRKVKFCSIKAFWDKTPDTFLRFLVSRTTFRSFLSRLLLSQPEPSCNGPPKGFVPLPDVEIGGCARNDSLIAPAI